MAKLLTGIGLITFVAFFMACQPDARTLYHQGSMLLQAGDYASALDKFEAGLVQQPGSKVLLFGKARALYGLKRFQEALPVFEEFLKATDGEKSLYKDERTDAAFYRDKCKTELGIEVPQNPAAVPEERMRY